VAGNVARGHESLSTTELVARLERSRQSLMDAISSLDEEGFRARPQQGEWSIAETLAHLLTTERISLERARIVLVQDNPEIRWIEDEALNDLARSAQRMPVPQVIHGMLAQRRDVTVLLESLSPDQLARPYRHERLGDHTDAWLFARMAEHEDEHAEEIASRRAGAAVQR
jgi:hypothetical protein